MEAKISVIIPCYNAIRFLKDTLDSVFRQNHSNLEIIVIDDGSTDGSLEYLGGLQDARLMVKKNKGKGACAARNYGFQLSTGDYIQFLDADDFFSPEKIEEQVNLLKPNGAKIALCSTVHFTKKPEDGVIVDSDFLYSTNCPTAFLLNLYGAKGAHSMVQTSAWLTPRELIHKAGLWDESLHKDQDGEFFCRVVMQSEGIVYAPNSLNYYRKHSGGSNIANQKEKIHVKSQLQALNSKKEQLLAASETKDFKNAFALQYKIIAINAYPKFKDIYKQAIESSKALGGSSYLPVLGGKLIEKIKNTFGWKSAKLCRQFLHQIRAVLKSFKNLVT